VQIVAVTGTICTGGTNPAQNPLAGSLAAMLAVIPVRDGQLPGGADETVAECGGRALVAGSGTAAAAGALTTAVATSTVELGAFAAARWSAALATALADEDVVVLPASADGRDLAPRLAHVLRRPLLAGAVAVAAHSVRVVRAGGTELHEHRPTHPFVATLVPGVRGVETTTTAAASVPVELSLACPDAIDAETVELLPPDVTTMDLTEATRILGGGAGLDGAERFAQLTAIAGKLGAAMAATRVVTDRGWVPHQRQIGTTGAVVTPRLYVAFGISGAVQHTNGLGQPEHVISVNTDAACPMMQLADVAIVADANAVLDELSLLLNVEVGAARG
jgi:electron transfer flavoprotein alpha subunit